MKWTKKLEDRIYDRIMHNLEQRLYGCARLFLFTKAQREMCRAYGQGIPVGMLRPVDANTAIKMILDHLGLELAINEEKKPEKDILLVQKELPGNDAQTK